LVTGVIHSRRIDATSTKCGALARAGRIATGSDADQMADPVERAEKYVTSTAAAIRRRLLNSGTSDGPRKYLGSITAAASAS